MKIQDTRAINPSITEEQIITSIIRPAIGENNCGSFTWLPSYLHTHTEVTLPLSFDAKFKDSDKQSFNSGFSQSVTFKRAKSIFAAFYIDLAAFSGNNDRTRGLETFQITSSISKRKRAEVTISKKLRVPRSQALANSLLAPSGVYMSWLEMNGSE